MAEKISRQEALKRMALGGVALGAGLGCSTESQANPKKMEPFKGNINHSACRWCYSKIELADLCAALYDMGIKGIDLLNPDEWKVAQKAGLEVSLSFGSPLGIPKGFNDPANHAQLLKDYQDIIPRAQDEGVKRVIVFSGNRNGISDEEGLKNSREGLMPVAELAAKHNVMLVMELLNSKHNHPDYQCDRTPWGVELVKAVGSDHFRLLYDIYHMQIMEGDVIHTIQTYHPYFDHYHTGGVPGRNEIDERQELYYPAIMKAIVETGYKGFVAQEFIPKDPNPLESLAKGVRICDV
ncbi:MAG: TIM barrel protein [Bacteroidota bacterium]